MPISLPVLFAAVRDGQWYWGLGDPDLGAVLVTGLYFLVAGLCLAVARQLRWTPGRPLIRPAATFSPDDGGEGTSEKAGSVIRPAASPLIRPAATFSPVVGEEGTRAQSAPSFGQRPPSPPLSGEKKNSGEVWAWYTLSVIMFCLGINKQADLQSLLTLYGRDILRTAGLYDVRREIQVVFITGVMLVAALTSLSALWMARRWSWACRFAAVGLGFQAAFIVIRAASFHHVDRLLRIQLATVKMNLLIESIGLFIVLIAAMTAWAFKKGVRNQ